MARPKRGQVPPAAAVDLAWRYAWMCRLTRLLADTAPAVAAVNAIDLSGGSLADRTADVEAVLAEHGVLDRVEGYLAFLLRARVRGGEGEETGAAIDILADSRLPAARRAL